MSGAEASPADPRARAVPDDELRVAAKLIREGRWAALASVAEGGEPHASMVAYAAAPGFESLVVHVSRLSRHTQNLLARPRGSLVIGEPDPGTGDPQTLARISLQCRAEPLARDTDEYRRSRALYLERLPHAEPLFGFADFVLFRLALESAHYVGGFARAYAFGAEKLQRAAAL